MEAMKNVLCNVWKSFFGMSIKEVRDRLYIFMFENQMEKERVLMRQPWTFNKSLMVLQDCEGKIKPEEVELLWCPFWVQIHGLPFGLVMKKIGAVLGEIIGDVEEIDAERGQMAFGLSKGESFYQHQ